MMDLRDDAGRPVTWLGDAADVLRGGREDRCEAGHESHPLCRAVILLDQRPVPDCPAPPVPLRFWFNVFDPNATGSFDSYCSADDELSRSVIEQGSWEPWETALAMTILHGDDGGAVLDLGSHVGWYTMLAALAGREVLAVDAEVEHLDVLAGNAAMNGVASLVTTARGWIDSDTRVLRPVGHVRLVKIDLEGAEDDAVRILDGLLAAGKVDYVMVELSPEFGDGWRFAVDRLEARGYHGHLVPTKGDDLDGFEADPLGTVLACGPIPDDLAVQRTGLFARP